MYEHSNVCMFVCVYICVHACTHEKVFKAGPADRIAWFQNVHVHARTGGLLMPCKVGQNQKMHVYVHAHAEVILMPCKADPNDLTAFMQNLHVYVHACIKCLLMFTKRV